MMSSCLKYLKSLFLFRSFGLSNSLCCSFLIYALTYGVGDCSNAYAETNDSAREKAFTLMSKGRKSFEAEQYSEAIRLWREAYHTYQDNKLLLFIASTYSRIPNSCQVEDQAWLAYLHSCQESACPSKERGMERFQQFKKRCYLNIKIDSSAPRAKVSHEGQAWGPLPHERKVLINRYQQVKVSAPGYMSAWIDIDLKDPKVAQGKRFFDIPLTLIPKETFFEKHQLKLALSTTVIGVSLLGMGSLQMSSAGTLASEVEARMYPDEYKDYAEYQSYLKEYQADKDSFKSKQLWGSVMMTAGIATLGAGLWMLFYKGPNASVFEKARQQGDLAKGDLLDQKQTTESVWSFNPISSPISLLDGLEAKWTLKF